MTAPKFTPGPWRVIEHSWSDVGVYAGDHRVVLLSIRDEATELDQFELQDRDSANAHLIAAAPELYAALAALIPLAEEAHVGGPDTAELLNAANAALAKARGEQP